MEKSYRDNDDKQDDSKAAGSSKEKEEEKVPDSTLGPELQRLVKLTFNQS